MQVKRDIPKDWSVLSTQEIIDNVFYLQKHYKEYKITTVNDNTIKVGTVQMHKDCIKTPHGIEGFITINGMTIDAHKYPQLYYDMNTLYQNCENTIKPFKEKIKAKAINWWGDNRDFAVACGVIATIIAVIAITFCYDANQEKKKIQEQEKNRQEHESKTDDGFHTAGGMCCGDGKD